MRAALIFNGHSVKTVAEIDEETMSQIQTMYADGVLGTHGVINTLGTLTAGIFNYIRAANSPAMGVAKVLGAAHDYIYPPLPEQSKAQAISAGLMGFMSQSPGFAGTKLGATNG